MNISDATDRYLKSDTCNGNGALFVIRGYCPLMRIRQLHRTGGASWNMQAETTITGWAIVSAFGGAVVGASLGALTSYLLNGRAWAAKVLHDGDRGDSAGRLEDTRCFLK